MDFFIKYFFTQEVDFEFPRDDNEGNEYVYVPDIAEIADNLKSCFHVLLMGCRKENKFQETSIQCLKLRCLNMISKWYLKLALFLKAWKSSMSP